MTTKDPESKTKAFEKCLDVIKGAGVSDLWIERVWKLGDSVADVR